MEKEKITTYILTGGKSSRMGCDKATSLFNEKSFLTHILEAVKPLDTTIKLVSSLPEHQNLDIEIVLDADVDKGPVCGITSALSNTNTALNLILSCDIPLLQYNLVDWLINEHTSNYEATVICLNSKKMPLIAVYSKECLNVFKTHLNKNKLKLMHVLDNLNVNYVEVPEIWAKQITNVNTPEELKNIEL